MNTLHADSTELESRNLTVRVERVGRQYICRGLAKVKRDEHATGFDGIVLLIGAQSSRVKPGIG